MNGSAGALPGAVSNTLPSDTWVIEHPLNKRPSVTVVDTGDSHVAGGLEYVDDSTVIVSFSASFTGKAYLN